MKKEDHRMPKLLDLYCGAGGAAMGYHRAGFDDITGADIESQPHYPFRFVQADALEYLADHWQEYDAFHASPVCKGYSIMNNLPWLRDREYPYQILPTREMFQNIAAESGKPWVIENVYAARWGSKVLAKRGLEAHGLQAGWLCGLMFGLPLYRHRLFESSFFWMQPGHPKHQRIIRRSGTLGSRARDIVFSPAEDTRGIASWPNRRYTCKSGPYAGKIETTHRGGVTENLGGTLAVKQQGNGAQAKGVGVGHARGWRLAADAMGIDWMTRDELTQAIPPVYTEFIGKQLLMALGTPEGQRW